MCLTASTMKEAAEKKEEGEEQSLFNFADFDIEKVMKRGAVLVASGGQVRRQLFKCDTCHCTDTFWRRNLMTMKQSMTRHDWPISANN